MITQQFKNELRIKAADFNCGADPIMDYTYSPIINNQEQNEQNQNEQAPSINRLILTGLSAGVSLGVLYSIYMNGYDANYSDAATIFNECTKTCTPFYCQTTCETVDLNQAFKIGFATTAAATSMKFFQDTARYIGSKLR